MAINGQTVLAVIPARSGSKRCPGKNFKPYRGKVLYEWSIEAAKGSRYIDKIRVSMDTDRTPELCSDEAMNEDVLRYHLEQMPHDWVVLLQPTSPLRTAEDIDACIERAQMGHGCISYNRATGYKNGAVYVASREWIEQHDFGHQGLMRYLMDEERSLDIDFAADFDR
jgi:CMP-N-acetylneuraminic acid synthetase